MDKSIEVKELKYDSRSCNSCYARNYDTTIPTGIGHRVDKLYSLNIGNMQICLCEDCLKEVSNLIEDFLNEGNENV